MEFQGLDPEFEREFKAMLTNLVTERAGMARFYKEFSGIFLQTFPSVASAIQSMPVLKKAIAECILPAEDILVFEASGNSMVDMLHKQFLQNKVNNIWGKILKATYDQVMSSFFCVSMFVCLLRMHHILLFVAEAHC